MKKSVLSIAVGLCAAWIFAAGPAGGDGRAGTARRAGADDWAELGPDGGDIRGFVRNPKAPSELYAATSSGLIYRSGNNGATWARKGAAGSSVYDLAVDPRTPSTLYALGDATVYKSVNKGGDFATLPLPAGFRAQNGRVAVHPTDSRVLFVSGAFTYDTTNWKTCMAVLKSADGGQTWAVRRLNNGSASAMTYNIAVSAKTPSLVFACGFYTSDSGRAKAGVFRSRDGGATWKNVAPAFMTSGTICFYPFALALDPTDAGRAYVAFGQGVARTSDGGASWQRQTSPPATEMCAYSIAIDAADPETLYGGYNNRLYKSTDGGKVWSTLTNGVAGIPFKILARGKSVQAASGAGLSRSANGGASFVPGHKGIRASDISSFVLLPAGSGAAAGGGGTLYAASWSVGLFKSVDGGAAWTKLPAFSGSDQIWDVVSPEADPRRVTVSVFGADNPRVYGSADGGATFQPLLPATGSQGFLLAAFPSDPKRILAAGAVESGGASCLGVLLSADAGKSWKQTRLLNEAGSAADAVALAPSNASLLYVAGHTAAWNPVLYKSQTGGASWARVETPDDAAGGRFSCLAVHPRRPNTLYAVNDSVAIYKSVNGGATWAKPENGPAGARCLGFNPSNPNEIFVGRNDGLSFSADGGKTWTDLSAGLAVKSVVRIEIDGPARLIYAGIKGGGICRRNF